MSTGKGVSAATNITAELQAKHKDIDPFVLRKWERIFNAIFDLDCSHEVDWADFYIIVKKVRDIYGAESTQMQYAKESMKALWDGLVKIADQNKDQRIQLDEWIQVLKSSDPKNQSKWLNEYLTYMFKLFDVSADGKLDVAEYTDGMETYGLTTPEAHEAFKKFSVDAKGKYIPAIDINQFKKLWHEYFYSPDPKALGNALFGLKLA